LKHKTLIGGAGTHQTNEGNASFGVEKEPVRLRKGGVGAKLASERENGKGAGLGFA
jgi:hypothetical protein